MCYKQDAVNINWCFPGFLKPSQEKVPSGKLTWQWKIPHFVVGNTSTQSWSISQSAMLVDPGVYPNLGASAHPDSAIHSSVLHPSAIFEHQRNGLTSIKSTGPARHVENDCPFIHGLIKGNLMVNKPLIRPAISGGGGTLGGVG